MQLLYYSTAGDEIPVGNSRVSVNTLKKVQNGTMIAPPEVTIPSHVLLLDNHASKLQSSSTNKKRTMKAQHCKVSMISNVDYSGLVPVTLIANCIHYQQQKGIRDADSAQAAR